MYLLSYKNANTINIVISQVICYVFLGDWYQFGNYHRRWRGRRHFFSVIGHSSYKVGSSWNFQVSSLGIVHKLSWQIFEFFWPPSPHRWQFLPYKSWIPTHLFVWTYFLKKYPSMKSFPTYFPNSVHKSSKYSNKLLILLRIVIWIFLFEK